MLDSRIAVLWEIESHVHCKKHSTHLCVFGLLTSTLLGVQATCIKVLAMLLTNVKSRLPHWILDCAAHHDHLIS
jgi:hypothetical protein